MSTSEITRLTYISGYPNFSGRVIPTCGSRTRFLQVWKWWTTECSFKYEAYTLHIKVTINLYICIAPQSTVHIAVSICPHVPTRVTWDSGLLWRAFHIYMDHACASFGKNCFLTSSLVFSFLNRLIWTLILFYKREIHLSRM